jgi:nitrogen fixation/metabolism regulation signal transduction histidine kinase
LKKHETPVPIIGVWGIIFIYILLCIVTLFLSKFFFSIILQGGIITDWLMLAVFFSTPAVSFIFLIISLVRLVQDFITRRTGRRFQVKLLAYFTIVLLFSVIPLVLITNLSTAEIMRFWNTLDMESTVEYAQRFIVDAYALHLEKVQHVADTTDFDRLLANQPTEIPRGLIAVQDFKMVTAPAREDEPRWVSSRFWGKADQMLDTPPAQFQGVVTRNKNRDIDVIRYLMVIHATTVRVITYDLGEGFDAAIDTFNIQSSRFEVIKTLNIQFKHIVLLFFAVFFLPVVLVVLILAVSFTETITKPILDLTEATRKVATGDFSVHITAKKNDELGLLIHSFNTMVRDLEKTRKALIEAETRSIQQRMAEQLAHEIKNPLTPIKLSAERVLRRWQNNPENTGEIVASSMLSIIQETERLSTMLSEFRTLFRPIEPSVSNTAVSAVIDPLIASYRFSYPAITFTVNALDLTAAVKIDECRFTQIITNLVVNSIDAVNAMDAADAIHPSDVKRIEIQTDTIKKQGAVFCRISITDTGRGIPSDIREKIFIPYVTTKKEGTGLGLPIVERIISDHGGAIWFNSHVNLGTTFFVDLPSA